MKKLRVIIRNVGIVFAVLLVSLFIFSKIFEDKIIAKAIEIINDKVAVPISVSEVNLSVFHSFPFLTVDLINVEIDSPKEFDPKHFADLDKTHLASFNNVYISFNLKSVLSKSFDISRISLSKGSINILVNKKGLSNYQVFKTKDDHNEKNTEQSKELNLKSVQFDDITVNYVNLYKQLGVYTHTRQYLAKGKFVNEKYSITTRGSVQLNKYSSHEFSFVPKTPTNIKSNFIISNNILKIDEAQISTKGIQFNSIGEITLTDPVKIDLSLSGNDISIQSLFNMMPVKTDWINQISANGLLELDTRIMGTVTEKISPKVKSVFSIKEGYITHSKSNVEVNNLNLAGTYNNYNEPNLLISDFSFRSDSSKFKGNLELASFKKPVLTLKTNFDIDAKDVHEMFLKETVDTMSGKIKGQVELFGRVPKKFDYESVSAIGKRGNLEVNKFDIKIIDQKFSMEAVSGLMTIKKNSVYFEKLNGILQNTKLKCQGSIDNPLGILYDTVTEVSINGNLQADDLDFSNIEHWFLSESDTSSQNKTIYNIKTSLSLNKFKLKNFYANNIYGKLSYESDNLLVQPINFEAFGGYINSVISLESTENNIQILQTLTNTKNIEIDRFFAAFDNFNQTFITDKNISGKVTSSFESDITIVDGKFDSNSLGFMGHLNIVDGKLIDFEPAQKLSAFSNIDDLKELSFNTIENDILISNGKVIIPKMEIGTNVMDISIFGEQELNGDYEYHIKLLLSDLLHKKSKQVRERQSEFGTIEDDGLGQTSIYLVATGSDGKTKVRFDREELRSNLGNNLKEERKEIRKVLNKEFGWFKKDTTLKEKETKPQFQIEWEEE